MTSVSGMLTIQQVMRRLGVSERTLRRMMAAGEFPRPAVIGRRRVRWPLSDVTGYLERIIQQRQAPTEAASPAPGA